MGGLVDTRGQGLTDKTYVAVEEPVKMDPQGIGDVLAEDSPFVTQHPDAEHSLELAPAEAIAAT